MRIVGVELDRAHRLDAKQIGLAGHPGGTGDESTHECVVRCNLDGAVCRFNREVGEIEALLDAANLSAPRGKAPSPLAIEYENESGPRSRVSRLIAREPFQALARFCDRLKNGCVCRNSDHALDDALIGRQLRARLVLDAPVFGGADSSPIAADHGACLPGQLILNRKQVGRGHVYLEGLAPNLRAGSRVGQMNVDAR